MKGVVEIPFVKMHGIGNDYIYIDCLKGESPCYLNEEILPDLTRKISDRHFGIGSDGLILIQPSEKADFRMRIFNSDGSEAKMCGNGIRCVGKYVYDLGFTVKKDFTVETNSGIKNLKLRVNRDKVESVIVNMGSPYFLRKLIPAKGNPEEECIDQIIKTTSGDVKISGVSMGNPHGVVYVKGVESLDLKKIGPELENNNIWPDRANIEFTEVISDKEIKVRVWERGSQETMACGTGACAAVVMSKRKGLTGSEVTVHLKGGDLNISYDCENNEVTMQGPAELISRGVYYYTMPDKSDKN